MDKLQSKVEEYTQALNETVQNIANLTVRREQLRGAILALKEVIATESEEAQKEDTE